MVIRAYHRPTGQWRWAILGYEGKYARVDPDCGETLEDFDIWEVTEVYKIDNKERFTPKKKLNLDKVYS